MNREGRKDEGGISGSRQSCSLTYTHSRLEGAVEKVWILVRKDLNFRFCGTRRPRWGGGVRGLRERPELFSEQGWSSGKVFGWLEGKHKFEDASVILHFKSRGLRAPHPPRSPLPRHLMKHQNSSCCCHLKAESFWW